MTRGRSRAANDMQATSASAVTGNVLCRQWSLRSRMRPGAHRAKGGRVRLLPAKTVIIWAGIYAMYPGCPDTVRPTKGPLSKQEDRLKPLRRGLGRPRISRVHVGARLALRKLSPWLMRRRMETCASLFQVACVVPAAAAGMRCRG